MTMMAIGGMGQTMVDLGISGTKLPEGPLAVGQTWKSELNIGKVLNEQSGGMVTSDKSLPVEYKVEGFEMIDGVEHVKITSTTVGSVPISSPMAGEGTLESNTVGTILVNMTNGIATKSSIEGTQTSRASKARKRLISGWSSSRSRSSRLTNSRRTDHQSSITQVHPWPPVGQGCFSLPNTLE